MTVNFVLNKQAFAKPYFPISSQGLMYFATSTQTFLSDLFSGSEAWERQLFSAPTAKTITAGTLAAPTQLLHTVTSESSNSDDLDTIPAVNNTALILKATAGHTITIRSGYGNIRTMAGAPVIINGNRTAKLWCQGGQWSVISSKRTQHDVAAILDPSSYDDIGDNFSVGSLWINVVQDRVWLCTSAALSNARWSLLTPLKNGFFGRASDTGILSHGYSLPWSAAGTPTSANDATDTWVSLATAASLNALAGFYAGGTNGTVRSSYPILAEWTMKTGASVSLLRMWTGVGDPSNADTLAAGEEFIGFRYSTAAGDTGFRPVLNDGTTQNTGTAIPIAIAANTEYRFRIRLDPFSTNAWFSVNEYPEQQHSTNYPPNTEDLAFIGRIWTLDTNSKSILYSSGRVGW